MEQSTDRPRPFPYTWIEWALFMAVLILCAAACEIGLLVAGAILTGSHGSITVLHGEVGRGGTACVIAAAGTRAPMSDCPPPEVATSVEAQVAGGEIVATRWRGSRGWRTTPGLEADRLEGALCALLFLGGPYAFVAASAIHDMSARNAITPSTVRYRQ